MGELLAQEFLLVRREIHHQQPPARAQHPRRLFDRARAVVEEVQHLMQNNDVEGIVAERQVVNVALPHAAMFQAGALQPVARQEQHVEREVETEPALDLRTVQFEHAPGAGAEVEQRAERFAGKRGADRGFDRVVGDVQLADAVPFRGVGAEVGLRRGGARLPH